MAPGGRNYTITMRIGEDGTRYVRIREVPAAQGRSVRRSARHWVSVLADSLTMLKAGFQKVLRSASRRA